MNEVGHGGYTSSQYGLWTDGADVHGLGTVDLLIQ
jgi:hypothetical protein